MNVKNIITILFLSIICLKSVKAQELSASLQVVGYQTEPQPSKFDSWLVNGAGLISISFADSLSRNWDYNVGIGYLGFREDNYSKIQIQPVDPRFVNTGIVIGNFYNTSYLALSLGAKYWFRESRKGFFADIQLVPHILTGSVLRNRDFEDNNESIIEFKSDSSDNYNSFNLVSMTGVGYRLKVSEHIFIQLSLSVVVKFRNVVKVVDEGVRLSRGLTLGGGYRF